MIAEIVIKELIELGAASEPRVPPCLRSPEAAWRLLMQGDEPWRLVAKRLSSPDLCALIRGIVLFNQASAWSGGSVSPVIPLYRESLTRSDIDEPELSSWIVAHRRNEYEPFGTMLHSTARTQAELRHAQADRERDRAARLARESAKQAAGAASKGAAATKHLAKAVIRGDIAGVQGLLLQGAIWQDATPSGESLVQLARANGRELMAAFLEQQGIT